MFRQSAYVYDLIYEAMGKDYAAEAAVVDALVRERNPGSRTLLDVACGTGGHLRHLRDAYDVMGVDLDPSMLGEARRHLPDAPLVEADMRSFDLGVRFDAVICLFSSIGYMASTAELEAAIEAMARHLHDGGVLIVDGWVRPDAWRGGGSTHRHSGRRRAPRRPAPTHPLHPRRVRSGLPRSGPRRRRGREPDGGP